MLKEAIEAIGKLAVGYAMPTMLGEIDPRQVHLMDAEGKLTTIDRPPPLRKQRPMALASLVTLAGENMGTEPPARLWVSEQRVVLEFDPADRREWAEYRLIHADRWIAVVQRLCRDKEPFSQQALVRFLRCELGLPEPVVGKFRALQWASEDGGSSTVTHGADKLGRQIRREVINAAEIPQEIFVPIHVYSGEAEREFVFELPLLVEIDTTNRQIWLVPKPDAMTSITERTLASIVDWLAGEMTHDETVLLGEPT